MSPCPSLISKRVSSECKFLLSRQANETLSPKEKKRGVECPHLFDLLRIDVPLERVGPCGCALSVCRCLECSYPMQAVQTSRALAYDKPAFKRCHRASPVVPVNSSTRLFSCATGESAHSMEFQCTISMDNVPLLPLTSSSYRAGNGKHDTMSNNHVPTIRPSARSSISRGESSATGTRPSCIGSWKTQYSKWNYQYSIYLFQDSFLN